MLPKRTIRRFLERPRRDLQWIKRLTLPELEDRQRKLPVAPPIWYKLHREQKVCFLLGTMFDRFAYWVDTGIGKTLISIALTRYYRRLGTINQVLVLVPNKVNKGEWAREIEKHSPKTRYLILSGSSEDKWRQLEETPAHIIVETYAGLSRMLCPLVEGVKGKRGKKGRDHLRPTQTLIKRLLKYVDGVFLDESNAIGSHESLPFRVTRQLTKHVKILYCLSGTPFGRDPTPLWAQMFVLDKGETLGETLGLFRAAFFSEHENYFGGRVYTFQSKNTALLNRFLRNRSVRYEVDAADLPALTHIVKEVYLPEEAQAYYDKAKAVILAARGNYREMKNAFLRMRQISSGFMGFFDDEEGTRAQFEFGENPKLEMLMSLIESIRPDRKILVFHDFVYSGGVIASALKDAKVKFIRLTHKSDPAPLLKQFDHDPEIRVFVLSTAGAYGLNLQIAQYGIFYESPVPVILRKQMIRRFERQYSAHTKVFLYDLVVAGTMDQRILDFYAEGTSLFDAIVQGKVKI